MLKIYFICICSTLLTLATATNIELGKVNWTRDLKQAQQKARTSHKPILILFQEVPGCSTCKNYGTQVLSHPLVVEAIETYFVPLCIFNNHQGPDKEALLFFNEPSWNNPVVRIVDADLKNMVDRLNGNYTAFGLISKINAVLIKTGIAIPSYLQLLEEEQRALQSGVLQTTLGMYCFWSGEKTFGNQKGVIATNAGFMNGSEVVEITYDPKQTNLETLVRIGIQNNCADKLYTNEQLPSNLNIKQSKKSPLRVDLETKYYLFRSDYKYVPMTSLQALRANSLIAEGKSCEGVLSPRQINRYHRLKSLHASKLKNQIGRDIITAWYE